MLLSSMMSRNRYIIGFIMLTDIYVIIIYEALMDSTWVNKTIAKELRNNHATNMQRLD